MLDQKRPVSIKLKAMGGIFTAIFSSVCCTLPLIFTALGVGAGATGFLGGAGRLAGALIPYRSVFVLLTVLFIGLGYRALYRKGSACDSSVCSPEKIRRSKRVWFVVAAICLILVVFPYLLEMFS